MTQNTLDKQTQYTEIIDVPQADNSKSISYAVVITNPRTTQTVEFSINSYNDAVKFCRVIDGAIAYYTTD